ncbi:unnamed protein product [Orchesella dallaii]|uniref:Uncharacterized protein n=1 Tax=Orchesella dallaii TaxID=48710 RepID=A0ABP1Q3C3_9HEXA
MAEIRECYRVLCNWCSESSIVNDKNKTKAVYFYKYHNPQSKNLVSNASNALDLNTTKIEVVKKFRYLGVIVDPTLSFSEHFKQVETKMNLALSKMYNFNPFFSPNIVWTKRLFLAVMSIPDFCISISSVHETAQLQKLQSKINIFFLTFFVKSKAKRVKKVTTENSILSGISIKLNLRTIIGRR